MRDAFPDHVLLDSSNFELLRRKQRPFEPRPIAMMMICVVHHHSHFVAIGYDPVKTKACSFDCEVDHCNMHRRDLVRQFGTQIKEEGNPVDSVQSIRPRRFGWSRGSRDT